MKRLALFAPLLFACAVAFAAVITYSWENATTNVDGSPIPTSGDGRIVATNVEYGPCNAARDGLASVTNTIVISGAGTSAATPDLPPGTWCARAAHVNSYGVASDWTAAVAHTVAPPKPNPPRNFTIG